MADRIKKDVEVNYQARVRGLKDVQKALDPKKLAQGFSVLSRELDKIVSKFERLGKLVQSVNARAAGVAAPLARAAGTGGSAFESGRIGKAYGGRFGIAPAEAFAAAAARRVNQQQFARTYADPGVAVRMDEMREVGRMDRRVRRALARARRERDRGFNRRDTDLDPHAIPQRRDTARDPFAVPSVVGRDTAFEPGIGQRMEKVREASKNERRAKRVMAQARREREESPRRHDTDVDPYVLGREVGGGAARRAPRSPEERIRDRDRENQEKLEQHQRRLDLNYANRIRLDQLKDQRAEVRHAGALGRRWERAQARAQGLPPPGMPAGLAEIQRQNLWAPGVGRMARMLGMGGAQGIGRVRAGMGAAAMAAGVWSGRPWAGAAGGFAGGMMGGMTPLGAGLMGAAMVPYAAAVGLARKGYGDVPLGLSMGKAMMRIPVEPDAYSHKRRTRIVKDLGGLSDFGVDLNEGMAMGGRYGAAAGGFMAGSNRRAMTGDLRLAAAMGLDPEALGTLQRARRRGGVTGFSRGGGTYGRKLVSFGLQAGLGGSEIDELLAGMAQRSTRAQQTGTLTNIPGIAYAGHGLASNIGITQGLRVAGQMGNYTEALSRRGVQGGPEMGLELLALQAFGGLQLTGKTGISAGAMWESRKKMEQEGPSEAGMRRLMAFSMRAAGGDRGLGMQYTSDILSRMGVEAGPTMVEALAGNTVSPEWRKGRQFRAFGPWRTGQAADRYEQLAKTDIASDRYTQATVLEASAESLKTLAGVDWGAISAGLGKMVAIGEQVVARYTGGLFSPAPASAPAFTLGSVPASVAP